MKAYLLYIKVYLLLVFAQVNIIWAEELFITVISISKLFIGYLQVVLTSTKPSELCVNGMSFSRRSSKWANSALVVTVSAEDFSSLNFQGPLAGVDFQVQYGI